MTMCGGVRAFSFVAVRIGPATVDAGCSDGAVKARLDVKPTANSA